MYASFMRPFTAAFVYSRTVVWEAWIKTPLTLCAQQSGQSTCHRRLG